MTTLKYFLNSNALLHCLGIRGHKLLQQTYNLYFILRFLFFYNETNFRRKSCFFRYLCVWKSSFQAIFNASVIRICLAPKITLSMSKERLIIIDPLVKWSDCHPFSRKKKHVVPISDSGAQRLGLVINSFLNNMHTPFGLCVKIWRIFTHFFFFVFNNIDHDHTIIQKENIEMRTKRKKEGRISEENIRRDKCPDDQMNESSKKQTE